MAMAQAMVIMKTLCGNQFKPKACILIMPESPIRQFMNAFLDHQFTEQSKTELTLIAI